MRVEISEHSLTCFREPSDKCPSTESQLLYHLKDILNHQGYDLIKKEMCKDGHLVSQGMYYLRPRSPKSKLQVYIYDGKWSIRDSVKDFKKESATFIVEQLDRDE